MADLFDILSTEPSVERIGPTKVRDIRIITAVAKPSGVVFSFPVVPADYGASHVNLIAHDTAVAFNTLAAKPGVVAVRVEQNTDAADRFVWIVYVTVESSSGNSEADVRLSWGEAWGAGNYAKITKARQQLDEIEGL